MNPVRAAWRVIVDPRAAWRELGADGAAARPVLAFAVPMALLPATGWSLRPGEFALADRLGAFAMTYVLVLAMVVALAAAIHLVAPMYGIPRRWRAALAVAAYGSAPILACGPLFVSPLLAAVGVFAMLHCLYLYWTGLQDVMHCRRGDAAEYVAITFMLSSVLAGIAGALCSAAGWI